MNTPIVRVGLLSAPHVQLCMCGKYLCGQRQVTGDVAADADSLREPLLFQPFDDDCYVEVRDVTIGVNFHWQRKENQRFKGEICLKPHEGQITVINILPVETYLESVISSEMSATSSLEFLKAHAVISRSWLMAQITNREHKEEERQEAISPGRIMRWYGHGDHTLFDVCADDHCQRYQGITRQTTPLAAEAVAQTRGEVLMYGGGYCDARFSKCCGGVMEVFESCWEDEHKEYLEARRDYIDTSDFPDLTDEHNAHKWIEDSPEAFCNTRDKEILGQVLVGYDQETADFYRWTVEYTTEQLSEIVARKSSIDFGRILSLEPVKRGKSGRIIQLRIVGEKETVIVGKELEIRRWLSETHLYSSAFVVEKTDAGFRLRGAGWGHGVGLCQIGAAVMASRGYTYRDILHHYYPNAKL